MELYHLKFLRNVKPRAMLEYTASTVPHCGHREASSILLLFWAGCCGHVCVTRHCLSWCQSNPSALPEESGTRASGSLHSRWLDEISVEQSLSSQPLALEPWHESLGTGVRERSPSRMFRVTLCPRHQPSSLSGDSSAWILRFCTSGGWGTDCSSFWAISSRMLV